MEWLHYRYILYRRLVEKYGPYREWEIGSRPIKDDEGDYKKFINDMANGLSLISGMKCTVRLYNSKLLGLLLTGYCKRYR